MNIEEALKCIHKRASEQKNYKPDLKDIEAVNLVVEWITRGKKQNLIKHQMFAKLYTIYFGELVSYYKNIDQAQKEIHKQLSEPLQNHIYWFREKFNLVEHGNAMKEIGLTNKPWWSQTKEEQEIEKKILEENQEFFLKHVQKWSVEHITKSLENQITEAINRYDNNY